ncbi:MAG: phosphatase [Clostridia bacterium]|nr:phosphatase [Clostridia bacterium]
MDEKNRENELEQQIIATRKAYYKNWRAQNKDKVRKNNERYWRKKAEKELNESEQRLKD